MSVNLAQRCLSQKGGANVQAFAKDVGTFVAANKEHPVYKDAIAQLGSAMEAITSTAMRFLMWFNGGKMELVPLAANRFLEMMGEVAIAWLLLDGARIALDAKAALDPDAEEEHAFYEGKKQAALYFARSILPGVFAKSKILTAEDTSALDIPDEGF